MNCCKEIDQKMTMRNYSDGGEMSGQERIARRDILSQAYDEHTIY